VVSPELAVELVGDAVFTIINILLVLIVPGLVLGIIVAIIQAATSVQEQTLTFLPRMLLTLLMVVFTGHWLISTLVGWFANLAEIIPGVFA
jgi:flagellar biosynthetic protein FliQ